MKKIAILSLFVALTLSLVSGCGKIEEVEGPEIHQGSLVEISVPSIDPMINSYGDTFALVYLPPGYDTSQQSYPVVYLLHGFGGNHRTWQDMEDVKGILDYLISAGEIRPMIVVMPSGFSYMGGTFYTNSQYPPGGSDVFGMAENYIIHEVIPKIDSTFRTMPDRGHRAIIGLSMGGYGAAKLAIKHPDMFSVAGMHSGVLMFDSLARSTIMPPYPDLVIGIYQENGKTPPETLSVTELVNNLGPDHPLTTMLIAQAAAFSPKVAPLSFFDTLGYEVPLQELGMGLWVGVRLPFGADGMPNDVWDSIWLPYHDPARLLQANIDSVRSYGLQFYLDCGSEDELMLTGHTEGFLALLDELNLPHSGGVYDGVPGYPGNQFPPMHATHTYIMLKNSLKYASEHMEQ